MFIYILFVFCSHYCTAVSYTLRELFGQLQLSLKKYLCLIGVFVCIHTRDISFITLFLFIQWWFGGLAATVGQSQNPLKKQNSNHTLKLYYHEKSVII